MSQGLYDLAEEESVSLRTAGRLSAGWKPRFLALLEEAISAGPGGTVSRDAMAAAHFASMYFPMRFALASHTKDSKEERLGAANELRELHERIEFLLWSLFAGTVRTAGSKYEALDRLFWDDSAAVLGSAAEGAAWVSQTVEEIRRALDPADPSDPWDARIAVGLHFASFFADFWLVYGEVSPETERVDPLRALALPNHVRRVLTAWFSVEGVARDDRGRPVSAAQNQSTKASGLRIACESRLLGRPQPAERMQ